MRHLAVKVFNELDKLNQFLSYYHHEDIKEIIIKNIEYNGGTILNQYYVITYEDYLEDEV